MMGCEGRRGVGMKRRRRRRRRSQSIIIVITIIGRNVGYCHGDVDGGTAGIRQLAPPGAREVLCHGPQDVADWYVVNCDGNTAVSVAAQQTFRGLLVVCMVVGIERPTLAFVCCSAVVARLPEAESAGVQVAVMLPSAEGLLPVRGQSKRLEDA